jgi:hypothetical protein
MLRRKAYAFESASPRICAWKYRGSADFEDNANHRSMKHGFRVALLFLLCLTAAQAGASSVLNRGNGSEPKSLDPAFVDTAAE